jgi:hypothetical protein
MSIHTIGPHALGHVTSFLIRQEMIGLTMTCCVMATHTLPAFEDFGTHICFGCDLTGSMGETYNTLKKSLLRMM